MANPVKSKENKIPIVTIETPTEPPLQLKEFDIVQLKTPLPLFSRDAETRNKQLKDPYKLCPTVAAGGYLWVDSIKEAGPGGPIMIVLHPMNPIGNFDGLCFIGLQATGVVLLETGNSLNHPHRWRAYGKVGIPVAMWIFKWFDRFRRAGRIIIGG